VIAPSPPICTASSSKPPRRQPRSATLDKTVAAARLNDRNTLVDEIAARRAAYVEEAREKERVRKERLERLTADITQLDDDRADARKLHTARYQPRIALYERKMEGVLDPMEETIGLYKVIFLIAPDADAVEQREYPYRWMAGLFPFLVIFGTLFVLDLVPILAKVFSRPGPYDVLVDEREFVATETSAISSASIASAAAHGHGCTAARGRMWEREDVSLLERREVSASAAGEYAGLGRLDVAADALLDVHAEFAHAFAGAAGFDLSAEFVGQAGVLRQVIENEIARGLVGSEQVDVLQAEEGAARTARCIADRARDRARASHAFC